MNVTESVTQSNCDRLLTLAMSHTEWTWGKGEAHYH